MAATINVSCQQTRFNLDDGAPFQGLDIKDLSISIASSAESSLDAPVQERKSKAKAKAKVTDILSGAELKLKLGVRYGLIGKNGTGKSTILKAIADKLIPGIAPATRISILQQTTFQEQGLQKLSNLSLGDPPAKSDQQSALQYVIESDDYRNDYLQEVAVLSKSFENPTDHRAPVRALRQIRYERLKRQLFEAEKNARLRSGARGAQARAELIALETQVAQAKDFFVPEGLKTLTRLNQSDEEIIASQVEEEHQAAVELWNELQSQSDSFEISGLESRARTILKGLGFKESSTLHKSYAALSGGWRMRCHLASVLYQSRSADIMILDEPTNFLDLLGIVWLQRYLVDLSAVGVIIIVSHDRDFVDHVCEETVILRDRNLTYFRGNLSEYTADFESKKLYLGAMKEAQDRQIKHMKKSIAENIKEGNKSGDDNKLRMAKSRQKKVDERMGLQVSATGGRFKLSRDRAGFQNTLRAEIEVPVDEKGVAMVFPRAQELPFPGSLVSLEKASFRYSSSNSKDKQTTSAAVLQDIDLVVYMGDRIGIVGLNGSGKTTLINMLTGVTVPTQGRASRHPRLQLGYYSQLAVEDLQESGAADRSLTALSLLLKDVEGAFSEPEARALLGSLGLPGRIASDVPIGNLSGGQLVRLALARIIWKSPHLLVLDEISTHLDFYTVSALIQALEDFEGAVVLVSHDRFLIRCVVQGESQTDGNGGEAEVQDTDEKRRTVYSLKGGKLHVLGGGVQEFEAGLEKRIDKMFADGG